MSSKRVLMNSSPNHVAKNCRRGVSTGMPTCRSNQRAKGAHGHDGVDDGECEAGGRYRGTRALGNRALATLTVTPVTRTLIHSTPKIPHTTAMPKQVLP